MPAEVLQRCPGLERRALIDCGEQGRVRLGIELSYLTCNSDYVLYMSLLLLLLFHIGGFSFYIIYLKKNKS